jgi:phosphoribosylanthranilate isomerase
MIGSNKYWVYTELPNVRLVQVMHVVDNKSITKATEVSDVVDAILLCDRNPNLLVQKPRGTGTAGNRA